MRSYAGSSVQGRSECRQDVVVQTSEGLLGPLWSSPLNGAFVTVPDPTSSLF